MTDVLALAGRLRSMSDHDVAEVVRTRALATNGVKDFFDLAEAVLSEASVQRVLSRLERPALAVLAVAAALSGDGQPGDGQSGDGVMPSIADVTDRLIALGASDVSRDSIASRAAECAELLLATVDSDRIAVYEGVRTKLEAWPSLGLPGEAELASAVQPASLGSVPDTERRFVDRLAADRAFAATTAITELLTALEHEPARELARGGIGLPDTKRLASAMTVELDAVAPHLGVAERAGLLARDGSAWLCTDAGENWLLEPSSRRWAMLSAAWLDALPGDIRSLLSTRTRSLWGSGLRGYIDWLYPAGGDWMDERITTNTQHAELLGITAQSAPSTPGSLLLAGKTDAAETSMAELLPPEVEQLYLQHDLSVVAPGPLTPRVDARLRSLADVENRSLASTYRISASSLNRAMAAGETESSLLEFLGSVSLTGIPQPLSYLIAETARRYGLVRAGALPGGTDMRVQARSYLRSDDADLLAAIVVDQNLSALGLERVSATRILSRCELDMLFWAVSEARYPVAAEHENGTVFSLRRRHSTRAASAPEEDPVDVMLERLRLGGEPGTEENDQAWLVRQLEIAIRSHAALMVTVTMPNGSNVDYHLEPTSLASGRLRARDHNSAIERTLPLSSIAVIAAMP